MNLLPFWRGYQAQKMQKNTLSGHIFFGQCRTFMLGIMGNLIGLRRGKMTFNQASIDQAIEALKEQFGDRLSVAQSVREHRRPAAPLNLLAA